MISGKKKTCLPFILVLSICQKRFVLFFFFFWQKKCQDSLVLTLLLALELVQAYKNKSKQGKKKYKVYGLKRKSTKEEFDVGVMFCA